MMRPDSGLVVAEEEEEVVVEVVEEVVVSMKGPYVAWIQWFLVKYNDIRKLVTDRQTNRRTHPHKEMRGRI